MRPLVLLPLCAAVAACAPEPPTVAVPRAASLGGGRFVVNMAEPAGPPGPAPLQTAGLEGPATPGGPPATPPGRPSSTPDASPTPEASPSATPTPPPRSSGGGGRGSRPTPRPQEVLLVDEVGAPVEGATFTFGDGTGGTTDAAGSLGLITAFAGNRVSVGAPGFMTSEVFGLGFTDTLHLRRAGGASPPFDRRTTTVAGAIVAPAGFHSGLAAFSDALETANLGGAVAGDGTFSLRLTTQKAGEPRGAYVAICGNPAGGVMLGMSAPFRPFLDPPPAAFTMVPAARTITYTSAAPAGLERAVTRLELYPADAPRVVFDQSLSAAGTFIATADGALPGTWRVTATAADELGRRESVVSASPVGDRVDAVLLEPSTVTVDVGTRQVAWTPVAGARGYRVTLLRTDAGAAWEAFTTAGAAVTVPEAVWPGVGRGVVVVDAIDAPGLAARSLASLDGGPRRLRIDPWVDAVTYRVATTRAPF